jgi:putative membrane protein
MHFMEPWGWVWMLVWIAALLVMTWLIVRTPREQPTSDDAIGILRGRFARGEIDQQEFERARDVLLLEQRESKE